MFFLAVGHIFLASLQQQMENVDAERDIYDELLTQAEIQGNVNKVNGKPYKHSHFYVFMCLFDSTFKFQYLSGQ